MPDETELRRLLREERALVLPYSLATTAKKIARIGDEMKAARAETDVAVGDLEEKLADARGALSMCETGAGHMAVMLRNAKRRAEKMEAVLRDLIDDEPCRFDHHGYCQTHGWLQPGRCPVARARDLLAAERPS